MCQHDVVVLSLYGGRQVRYPRELYLLTLAAQGDEAAADQWRREYTSSESPEREGARSE